MWRYGRWEEQWTGLRTTRRPAFSRRGRAYAFNINGNAYSADGFDAEREWARGYWSALAPFQSSVYVNFLWRREKTAYVRPTEQPSTTG